MALKFKDYSGQVVQTGDLATDLESVKKQKIKELSENCRQTITRGFGVAINSTTTNEYENELHDQRNLALKGLRVLMDTNLTSVDHKTKNAGVFTHTRDEFLTVVKQADLHINKNVEKYRDLKARVKAATNKDEVYLIVW